MDLSLLNKGMWMAKSFWIRMNVGQVDREALEVKPCCVKEAWHLQ